MIGKKLNKVCCEDISLVENYEVAVNSDKLYCLHHRLEIQEENRLSVKELKEQKLYYHRPASELIFLPEQEHNKLHNPGKDTKAYVNPAAFSKKKYVWLTPDRKVKFMNYYQVKKWHPDWQYLSDDPSKFTTYDILNIELGN